MYREINNVDWPQKWRLAPCFNGFHYHHAIGIFDANRHGGQTIKPRGPTHSREVVETTVAYATNNFMSANPELL